MQILMVVLVDDYSIVASYIIEYRMQPLNTTIIHWSVGYLENTGAFVLYQ